MADDDDIWNFILGNNSNANTPSGNGAMATPDAQNGLDLTAGKPPTLGGAAMAGILGPIPEITPPQSLPSSLPSDEDSTEERGQKALAALNAELDRQHILRTVYPDFETALGAWADAARPIQRQYSTELNSNVYLTRDGWQFGSAYSSGERSKTNVIPDNEIPGGSYWGYIHTHPDNRGLDFSDEYTGKVRSDRSETHGFAYVALPNGQINGWAPSMPWTDPHNQGAQFIIRPPTS